MELEVPASRWPLVGRDVELDAIGEALADPRRATVRVRGRAGIGRSRLVDAVAERAARRGSCVIRLAGGRALREVAFAAIAGGLWPDGLIQPMSGVDALRVATRQVRHLAARRPALIVADDVHLFDPASQAVLEHLARTGAAVVVATAEGSDGSPTRTRDGPATASADHAELNLGPLGAGAVGALLGVALGGQVDTDAAHRFTELSGGNPLFLAELVTAAVDAGRLECGNGVWRLTGPPLVPEPLARRVVDGLDPAVRAVVEAVALAGPVPLARLVGLVGVVGPVTTDAIEHAEEAGLVRIVGHTVRVGDPLVGLTLRERVPALRAHRIRATLADVTDRRPVGPRELLDAAARAARAGAYQRAIDLARAARRAGGDRHASTLLLAGAHAALGRGDRAERLFAEAGEAAETEERLASCATARAAHLWLWLGRAAEANAVVRVSRARLAAPDLRALVTTARILTLIQSNRMHAAAALYARIATCGGRARTALAPLGLLIGAATGEPLPNVDDRACVDRPPVAGLVEVGRFAGLVSAGRLAEADEFATARYGRALQSADGAEWSARTLADGAEWSARTLADGDRAVWALARGHVARLAGCLDAAVTWLREANALLRNRMTVLGPPAVGVTLSELAIVEALRGDAAGARAAVDEAARHGGYLPARDLALAWVLAADGDLAGARDAAAGAAERAAATGNRIAAAHAWLDLARLGAPTEAAAGLGRLRARADLPRLFRRYAEGLTARDPTALDGCVGEFARLGFALLAAEAAVAGWAGRGGPVPPEVRPYAESPPLTLRLLGPVRVLTPRERQVADLAARGWSNRSIASHLFLSVRTVENHLHATYRKTGAANRSQLRAAARPGVSAVG